LEVEHRPVLAAEAVELLDPNRPSRGRTGPAGGLFVDATVGLGGHAEALLAAAPAAHLVGIDRDPQALELAARRLAPFGERVRLVHANFHRLEEALARLAVPPCGLAGFLADLGVSSMQLARPERGFSFRRAGPLDMRMGLAELTAADLLNQSSEAELEKIIRDYGEERQARRIARAIVQRRAEEPWETTVQLKRLIDRVKGGAPGREGRIDPATRVFQALRIAVNDELAGLESAIDQAVRMMESEGRLVVISYHSLEDRIVKHSLRDMARGDVDQVTGRPLAESQLLEVLTRKPLRPSEAEVAANPRARSARLRAARRL
jgi:16S rRNA (cytosine1402-N4)-methyltransferase